jgi:hypothetical protein
MRSQGLRSIVITGLIASLSAAVSHAEDGKWYDTLAVNGYIQGSYMNNLNRPSDNANDLRTFDDTTDGFNFNAFQLKVSKPMGDDNYAFTGKIHGGRDARITKSAGWSGGTDPDILEGYLTVATPGFKALNWTFGKFVTLEGLEVVESPMNINFSHGLLFNYAEPISHTGLKTSYAFSDKLSLTAGLVNGWDVGAEPAAAGNTGKTAIWQVASTLLPGLTANFQGAWGPEQAGRVDSKRTSLDFLVGYSGIPKLNLWLQANWGQDSHLGLNTDDTQAWKGLGLWAQYALHDYLNPGVRYEIFDDEDGGSRTLTSQTVKNFTVSNKMMLTKATGLRAEWRHDFSNVGVFTKRDGATGRVQNTLSADWYVLF